MPERRKPPRRRLGFFDAQDRVIGLNHIYRTASFGADGVNAMAKKHHEALDEVSTPEPDEELEDSELHDAERRAAIARERARRDGIS